MLKSNLFKIRSIFLADDDLDDLKLFQEALLDLNPFIEVQEISTGLSLLKALESSIPDLLFLDQNIPGANTLEIIPALRKDPIRKYLPVIVCSSSNRQKDIDEVYLAGANLYFTKPGSFQELKNDLGIILSLDWEYPEKITQRCLINGAFVEFKKSPLSGK